MILGQTTPESTLSDEAMKSTTSSPADGQTAVEVHAHESSVPMSYLQPHQPGIYADPPYGGLTPPNFLRTPPPTVDPLGGYK